MNRRLSLKTIFTLSFLGISSFTLKKWLDLENPADLIQLMSHKSLICELADTIIPRTTTPGAKDAQVENYIINVVQNCLPVREQNKFIRGLQKIDDFTNDSFSKKFVQCDASQRNITLDYFEKHDVYENEIFNKINKKIWGESFFYILKRLTVEGYCNSFKGATQGLAYISIPGSFESCLDLKLNQHSWATK